MEKIKEKITILGDGAWGTTLASVASQNGHQVIVWSTFPDYLEVLDKKRENTRYMPGISIPKEIRFEPDLALAVSSSDIIIFAIPSKFFREIARKIKELGISLRGKVFVNVAKGIEQKTLKRMTEVMKDELGNVKTAVFSGPTIASEVARGLPALIVASARDKKDAKRIQEIFSNSYFRVYTSTDVLGVEMGGPLKNIIAVVAGISDGVGFGSNAKAAILTRGIVEIQRLGSAMGAKKKTFTGLAGLGDLSTTCISPESRNRSFGERIGKGEKMEDIVKNSTAIIEGATTTEAIYGLSKKYKVEMPITEQVYLVLYQGKDPKQAIADLMNRERKPE
ncbi:MAG: NAD(P)H-dependent glycerol-3-phosphate dehydrogenase [Minisyncoccus archaeiphilus]|jgi:glycerol-3-phosphate dehydrogenase (NAD(P)+)|uniref:NAD(P)H-dependent glycerol-3-phosphate dehydrogenase n=1 Tax=Minisyncoccus archaeiphilus TaxID=3238481 RepID=UPI0009C9A582|nr:MAG: Glycerol-3-phosphate dehydrogenase (NAD(P)+) [Parcubacteria group bacterium ADurb.Bin216]GMX59858.1 MAG: NAD(P)H-dependent glycerol-3-phosphate dehydrogenase [Candidatus Parcubacteria bacterium]